MRNARRKTVRGAKYEREPFRVKRYLTAQEVRELRAHVGMLMRGEQPQPIRLELTGKDKAELALWKRPFKEDGHGTLRALQRVGAHADHQ
jgi:hypothetical protein